ncbi:hypothetical protein COOONC_26687 [Cooperia oncophora]
MLVEPTNTSIVLLNEINKRILENKSVYDQDILNELCSIQYHGVVCRNFEYKKSQMGNGEPYYLSDKDHSLMRPYIVNNNFYVGYEKQGGSPGQ